MTLAWIATLAIETSERTEEGRKINAASQPAWPAAAIVVVLLVSLIFLVSRAGGYRCWICCADDFRARRR
jgi:hypothetical protein